MTPYQWIGAAGMFGSMVVIAAAVFGPLVWGLGPERAPVPAEPCQDKGEMTADGLVFVRRARSVEEAPVDLVESSRI